MKMLISITACSFLMCAGFFLAVSIPSLQLSDVAYAQEIEEQEPEEMEEAEAEGQESEARAYSYIAQSGDSFTKMARKAVQTFGITEEVNLSGAQIIFAETQLTLSAGSPFLNVGQEVEISQSDVASWVERAQELSEEQEAAWGVYVSTVDFNTDSVGEPQE